MTFRPRKRPLEHPTPQAATAPPAQASSGRQLRPRLPPAPKPDPEPEPPRKRRKPTRKPPQIIDRKSIPPNRDCINTLPNELLHAIFIQVSSAVTLLRLGRVSRRFREMTTREGARVAFASRWFRENPLLLTDEELTCHPHRPLSSPDVGALLEWITRYFRRHFHTRPYICTTLHGELKTRGCVLPSMGSLFPNGDTVAKEQAAWNAPRAKKDDDPRSSEVRWKKMVQTCEARAMVAGRELELVPFMGWKGKWAKGYLSKLASSTVNAAGGGVGAPPLEEVKLDVEDVVLATHLHRVYGKMLKEEKTERRRSEREGFITEHRYLMERKVGTRRGWHQFWEGVRGRGCLCGVVAPIPLGEEKEEGRTDERGLQQVA
ncbi:hypothetical protein BJ508DRAFT_330088 [Ascobolus immersus RN42]|uniref:F-box domain-containing protein n=1 Tax=Ascobolus immersus RN42 TaxID=1160509 RepID=A0A3N4I066_ASCIM|nr:hypothetical protein BJ508DRAFT_330088 [Ascobolus immersus RN42]